MKRRISDRGLKMIQRFEAFVNHPYQDAGGTWTIGFGHTEGVTEDTPNITREQGVKLMLEDLRPIEGFINENLNLNQYQFDALCSLVFNEGIGRIKHSYLFDQLKEDPDSRKVAYQWIEFCLVKGKFSRGLLKRRCKELDYYYT